MKLRIEKDELTIEEEDNTLVSKLFKGVKANVTIRGRQINKIKDSTGKVLKDNLHPENIGKVEKIKKER